MTIESDVSVELKQLKVTGLDHMVLWVADLERSKRFYIDMLGLEVLREHLGPDTGEAKEMDADFRCFLRCGNQQIGLFERTGGDVCGTQEFNHLALNLEAGSRDSVRELLENAGFKVHGRRGDEGCIYLLDPDGHRVQLLTPTED